MDAHITHVYCCGCWAHDSITRTYILTLTGLCKSHDDSHVVALVGTYLRLNLGSMLATESLTGRVLCFIQLGETVSLHSL